MSAIPWPSPEATRAEIDRFIALHAEHKFAVIDCNGCDKPVGYVLGVDSVPLDEDVTLCRTCFAKHQAERRAAGASVANGPAIVCNACGVAVMPAMGSPLCTGCQSILGLIAAATI